MGNILLGIWFSEFECYRDNREQLLTQNKSYSDRFPQKSAQDILEAILFKIPPAW